LRSDPAVVADRRRQFGGWEWLGTILPTDSIVVPTDFDRLARLHIGGEPLVMCYGSQRQRSAPQGQRSLWPSHGLLQALATNRKEAWSAGRIARSPSPKRERPSPVRQVPIRAKVQHLADRALRDPASRRGSAARRSRHASGRMQHDRVAASLSAYEAGRISRPGGPAASGESHRQSCVPKLVSTMSRFKTRVSYGTRFRTCSQGWRPDVP
jgi:hypothetical protein